MKNKIAHLKRVDPILGTAIKKLILEKNGLDEDPGKRRNHFRSLVVAIVNQQLSGKAADTILKRFVALFPRKKFPKPEDVLNMAAAKMRKCGLSKMKVSFVKDLARHVIAKSVDFGKISRLGDEEVVEHLVRVKGIGRWTAEMFLIFSLGREDVFSYGDLGLRNAIRNLYGLKNHPTPAQAEKISSAWKPYRSLASRYLWASLEPIKQPHSGRNGPVPAQIGFSLLASPRLVRLGRTRQPSKHCSSRESRFSLETDPVPAVGSGLFDGLLDNR